MEYVRYNEVSFLSRFFSINFTITGAKNIAVYYNVDCLQSPIFPCDRRDRARVPVNGGHFDF